MRTDRRRHLLAPRVHRPPRCRRGRRRRRRSGRRVARAPRAGAAKGATGARTDAESTENDRLSSENARLREEVARLEGMVDALMMLVDRHGIDASGTGQTKEDAGAKSGNSESGNSERGNSESGPPIGDCDSMLEHWLRNHCVPAAAERLSGEREGTPVSAATRTGGGEENGDEHTERALADSPFEYHARDEREGEARKMPRSSRGRSPRRRRRSHPGGHAGDENVFDNVNKNHRVSPTSVVTTTPRWRSPSCARASRGRPSSQPQVHRDRIPDYSRRRLRSIAPVPFALATMPPPPPTTPPVVTARTGGDTRGRRRSGHR